MYLAFIIDITLDVQVLLVPRNGYNLPDEFFCEAEFPFMNIYFLKGYFSPQKVDCYSTSVSIGFYT